MDNAFLNRTIIAPKIPSEQTISRSLPFRSFAIGLRSHRYRAMEVSPGDRLGRYEVSEQIGSGNFSSVHRARHIYLDDEVAVKTLRSDTALGAESFLREAQALALLAHPNVVRVLDADIFNEIPFIAMELIKGQNLIDVRNRYKRFSIERTMDLIEELGGVLIKQEQKGILHLDIKPGNIFQRIDGSFCLFDYGLVGICQAVKKAPIGDLPREPRTFFSQIFGTPAYMAPEQASGKADQRRSIL